MRKVWSCLLLVVALAAPPAAFAQVAPESPLFLPPNAASGLGLYLIDAAGGGIGVVGIWRAPTWNYGLRLGLAEEPRDDLAVFGGVDFSGTVNRSSANLPLDIDWLVGAFASVGDNILLSAPLGLTAGHTFRAEGASFTPYASPRLVLDAWFGGDENDDSDLDLDLAVDLGLDMRFRGSGLTIRFGATFGDREAIGIGVVF